MDIDPEFSAGALALAAPLAAYLIAGEPWVGRRLYAQLAQRRDRDDRALTRYYGIALAFWGAAAALTAAAVLLSPQVKAADLGLTPPDDAVLAGIGVVLFAVAAVYGTVAMRRMARDGRNVPGRPAIAAMLPRTATERRLALAVAVADGVAGEIVYRGLLIALGVGVLGLNVHAAAVLAVAVYALAGLYQGARGLVVFAFFGAICTAPYLATGSLLLPIVLHTVLSARDLVLVPPAGPAERTAIAQGS